VYAISPSAANAADSFALPPSARRPINRHITAATIYRAAGGRHMIAISGPLTASAPGGIVEFPLADIASYRRVRRHLLQQAYSMPPTSWSRPGVWYQIARRIVDRAVDCIDAAPSRRGGQR
jgi:hypothetical protein